MCFLRETTSILTFVWPTLSVNVNARMSCNKYNEYGDKEGDGTAYGSTSRVLPCTVVPATCPSKPRSNEVESVLNVSTELKLPLDTILLPRFLGTFIIFLFLGSVFFSALQRGISAFRFSGRSPKIRLEFL